MNETQALEILKSGLDLAFKQGSFNMEQASSVIDSFKVLIEEHNRRESDSKQHDKPNNKKS